MTEVVGGNFLEVKAFYCQNGSKSMRGFNLPNSGFFSSPVVGVNPSSRNSVRPGGSEVQKYPETVLPAFAEYPLRKDGDECEKGIRRSFSVGGYASQGFAEVVKMPCAEARIASLDRGKFIMNKADREGWVTKGRGSHEDLA
jgi:hypothetical protein